MVAGVSSSKGSRKTREDVYTRPCPCGKSVTNLARFCEPGPEGRVTRAAVEVEKWKGGNVRAKVWRTRPSRSGRFRCFRTGSWVQANV